MINLKKKKKTGETQALLSLELCKSHKQMCASKKKKKKKKKHEPNIVEITHLCISHGVQTSVIYYLTCYVRLLSTKHAVLYEVTSGKHAWVSLEK